MTLIIGIFTRDIHDEKEIIFASDGLAHSYKNNKKIRQDEDVEKIRKLTPKICMGYAGKDSELFEDVYEELKNKTPKKIKMELVSFTEKLQEVIQKMLKTKKHREVEKELKRRKQLYRKFIVGGVFHNKLMLIGASPDDNYKINIVEAPPTFPDECVLVVGLNGEMQEKTYDILKKIRQKLNFSDIENIIRYTISEIAKLYPDKINDHIFIRRLSRNFDSEKYKGHDH